MARLGATPGGATRAPTTGRHAALLLLALACLLLPAARGVETLVFSHRVSGGAVAAEYFASNAEALSVAGDVSALMCTYIPYETI
jgi:hypothetical protein